MVMATALEPPLVLPWSNSSDGCTLRL